MVKIGLVARADNGGLGVQTWEIYKHLKPFKTMVVDISELNTYEQHNDRYPDGIFIKGFPRPNEIDDFLNGLDAVMTVETPYNYYLFSRAKELGIKTILQYNYEFLDYLQNPRLPMADLLLAPSLWHFDDVPFENKKFIPVPVNRELLPFKVREKANHFVHIAGHKTYEDRNGTNTVIEAGRIIDTMEEDIKITILTQDDLEHSGELPECIEINKNDVLNYWDVLQQDDYDCLLLPRRYGGLSLQLNEAMSLGLGVITSAVEPQKDFMPSWSMIDPIGSKKIMTRIEIDCYQFNAYDLAEKMARLHNNPDSAWLLSNKSNEIAQEIDWQTLLPVYQQTIEDLCKTS
jgi:glycosyltransferase involved in cell wall biosynthesis